MQRKILVVRLSSLGDVVLTAPVYRNLKAHWPDCRISVLVKPAFAPALEGAPFVDEVIVFRGFRDALRRIRAGGFTHFLDLHATVRSWLLRRLARVPQTAVYRKDALARRLFVFFGLDSPRLQRHTVDRYLDALAAWGVPAPHRELTLADYPAGAAPAPESPSVLVIQSAFLGDSLLTLPLARDLKKTLPGCRTTVLTLPGTADIFRGSPWVDEVLLDDKRGEHSGPRGLWRLAMELRGRRFAVALVPHRSLRSALLAWLSKTPRRIGFSSSAGWWLLTDQVPFTWLMHDLERNLALLKPLASAAGAGDPVYVSQDGAAQSALDSRLEADGVPSGASLVGVHPGSAWETKRWPEERFTEVCRQLARQGRRVVLVGGKQDKELCARVAAASGALDWAGRTTLPELRALMGRLCLFITNDSGPMHLATAAGVPTIGLFGPTTRELGFFPYGPGHKVLEHELSCRPCGLHGGRSCPHGHFLCMRLITTAEVLAAASELLAPKPEAAAR